MSPTAAVQPLEPAGLPRTLTGLGRCVVMGVLNVTPDSFSDGGAYLAPDHAVAHALALRAEGADLVDVGGESTRPGATRVDEGEEQRRVLPVVGALCDAGVAVSIDTMRASTAAAAVRAGACLVNDVSGGLADDAMASTIASLGVPIVAMHWRAHSDRMAAHAVYDDVVGEVVAELKARIDALTAAGVDRRAVIVDPGIGFAKQATHNWALLAHLDALRAIGCPLLVGASRKGFIGAVLDGTDGTPRPADQRATATASLSFLAAMHGAWAVRVHDVAGTVDALRVASALIEHGAAG